MKDQIVDNEELKESIEESQEDPAPQASTQDTDDVSVQSASPDDNSADTAKQWQDKFLRLSAEFDNYRKRTLREKMDLIAAGGEDVIKSLLGVMDDIDRALTAMAQSNDLDALRQGVVLIHQKLMDTLQSKGVAEIEALGQTLDTDLHEAVAKLPVDADHKGKIVDVVQKGYKLKDKVVRYAKVVVGE